MSKIYNHYIELQESGLYDYEVLYEKEEDCVKGKHEAEYIAAEPDNGINEFYGCSVCGEEFPTPEPYDI